MAADGVSSDTRGDPQGQEPDNVKDKKLNLQIFPSLNLCGDMPQKLSQSFGGMIRQKEQFGTPSYPSPLDRIRTGKRNRGAELGLTESFTTADLNQTYPSKHSKSKLPVPLSALPEVSITLEDFKGDELNTFSFSTRPAARGSLDKSASSPHLSMSMGQSWAFYNFVGGGEMGSSFPTTVQNPNKAILTIEARTTKILVVNKMACELFGLPADKLTGMKMTNLLSIKDRERPDVLQEHHLDTSGRVVIVSGKVFEVVDSSGLVIPVSLWMKKVTEEANPKCLVVLEPVERTTARIIFDATGTILQADRQMAILYGYEEEKSLVGVSLQQLIPSITLPSKCNREIPQAVKKQQLTGKTKEGYLFPLSIHLKVCSSTETDEDSAFIEDTDTADTMFFQGSLWVFANISGMLSFLPNGNIHSINNNFSLMLFGFTQQDLAGQPITELIPNFYDHLDVIDDSSMPLPPLDDDDDDDEEENETDEDNLPTSRPASCFPDVSNKETSKELPKKEMTGRLEIGEAAEQIEDGSYRPSTLLQEADAMLAKQCPELRTSSASSVELVNTDSNEGSKAYSPVVSVSTTPPGSHTSLDVLVGSHSIQGSVGNLSAISGLDDVDRNSLSDCNNIDEEIEKQRVCSTKSSDLGIQPFSKEKLRRHSDGVSISVRSPPEEPLIREALLRVSLEEDSGSKNRDRSSYVELPSKADHYADVERWAYDVKHHFHISERNVSEEDEATKDKSGVDSKGDNIIDEIDQNQNEFKSRENDLRESNGGKDDNQDTHVTPRRINDDLGIDGRKIDILEALQGRITSTPASKLPRQFSLTVSSIPEGSFQGHGRHKDGNLLGILFQIKRVELQDGSCLYCMWMSRDPSDAGEGGRLNSSVAFASTFSSTSNLSTGNNNKSLGQAVAEAARCNSTVMEEDLDRLGCGDYSKHYTTLQSIGKGAFGFVKMGRKITDDTSVVVKFIRKSKIFSSNWWMDQDHGRLPLEIALLISLDHRNIVKVLDFYQNEEFFQMVMEKHGSGMDLFEFIDRQPNFDEALASYMFRQLVDGVGYLHSKMIVHRDIKDENVILNERFHIKIIDFGSAAYFERGKVFSTFCGTLEYCAPEVIQGNKYEGPELEMWAIGVTLYTLVFGENPFYDIEETIQASLKPPFPVSNELMQLIAWLLHPEPEWRCTLKEMENNAWLHQPCDINDYKWDQVIPENPTDPSQFWESQNKLDASASSSMDEDHLRLEMQRWHHENVTNGEDTSNKSGKKLNTVW